MSINFDILWTVFLGAGGAMAGYAGVMSAVSRSRESRARGRVDYVTEQHRRIAQLEEDVDELREKLSQISSHLIAAERKAAMFEAKYEAEHAAHLATMARLDEATRPPK